MYLGDHVDPCQQENFRAPVPREGTVPYSEVGLCNHGKLEGILEEAGEEVEKLLELN